MGLPREASYGFGNMSANVVVIATQEGAIGKNGWFVR
jgi:hypothetical protein